MPHPQRPPLLVNLALVPHWLAASDTLARMKASSDVRTQPGPVPLTYPADTLRGFSNGCDSPCRHSSVQGSLHTELL